MEWFIWISITAILVALGFILGWTIGATRREQEVRSRFVKRGSERPTGQTKTQVAATAVATRSRGARQYRTAIRARRNPKG